jgi:hypothetical protein
MDAASWVRECDHYPVLYTPHVIQTPCNMCCAIRNHPVAYAMLGCQVIDVGSHGSLQAIQRCIPLLWTWPLPSRWSCCSKALRTCQSVQQSRTSHRLCLARYAHLRCSVGQDRHTLLQLLCVPYTHTQVPRRPGGHTAGTPHGAVTAIAFAAGVSRTYMVELQTGSVLLQRGLSTFLTAPSLSRFLQKLLT